MWRVIAAGFLALAQPVSAQTASAEDAVPSFRYQGFENTDFYGADLQALFDVDLTSCRRLCETDQTCVGFVYNRVSQACFPKSAMEAPSVYDGAFSVVKHKVADTDIALGQQRAAALSFLRSTDIGAAANMARDLGLHTVWPDKDLDTLIQAARRAWRSGRKDIASQTMAQAVLLADRADLWVEYARYLRGDESGSYDTLQRRRTETLSAAINGYLRATDVDGQATALMQMAWALEDLDRGRDMIPALRLAQSLSPRRAAADLLDQAIGKYGFRVTDSSVQSDSAQPEICVTFSERLLGQTQDYEPFVRLPETGLVVRSNGQQLCIDGVQHGSRYEVTLRSGLPAASGEVLNKDVTLTHYVRDREPLVRFPGRAYVLARSGIAALPVVTVNLTDLELRLRRVSDRNLLRSFQEGYFARPLSHWQEQDFSNAVAVDVWDGRAEVQQELNTDVTSRLPLAEALQGQPVGIYTLSAHIPGADTYQNPAATQWFVLTDLGLSTMSGADGLHVQVQSLGDATPRGEIEVSLISSANTVLGTTHTDASGYAHFDAGLTRGQGSSAPALIIARDKAEDFAFLSLLDPAFDLSDRGVEGRNTPGPVDVFLATERGAYRAGETITATALARDAQTKAIEGLPLIAVLTRPDGVEYARQISGGGQMGGHGFTFPIAPTAPRGTWQLEILTDPQGPPLSVKRLLVEDFVPEQIDFTQTVADPMLRFDKTSQLAIEARYLFGAPGADLTVEGDVNLSVSPTLAEWPGYSFGRHDDTPGRSHRNLRGQTTDAQGNASLAVVLPDAPIAGRPLEAEIVTRLRDGSARPVERVLRLPVQAQTPMIGIRNGFEDVVQEGTSARFDVIALAPDLTPMSMPVRWVLNRVETQYQWYQIQGDWKWEATTRRTRIAQGDATLGEKALELDLPVEWGAYELVVERTDGTYQSASQSFYAGWYAAADGGEAPDRLEMSLDNDTFTVGETARLRILSPDGGNALVSVLSNTLIERRAVTLEPGETLVPLQVTSEWGSGAYISATVLQPLAQKADQTPTRALGIAHATVTQPGQELSVSFETPEILRPRATQSVRLKVDGAAPGEPVFVSMAAVDLGILNLTGFQTPDPSAYFYGQRRLGMELRDLYGRLIDPGNGALGQVRSGGDAGAGLGLQSPPPTQELMARSSGVLQVGADGWVTFPFDVPAFNGSIRLMAVAWSKSAVGQTETEVIVRDPVVVAASLPQFLSPGDQSRVRIDVTHVEGPVGAMDLSVSSSQPFVQVGAFPQQVILNDGQKQTLEVPIVAADVTGTATLALTLTTPDGQKLSQDLQIAVVANDPAVSTTRRFRLAAGDSFTFTDDVFADLQPGTARALLSAGPLARFDVPGLLSQLDRYPYGCTEQVTSRALPLLYLSSVAEMSGLAAEPDLSIRVKEAVDTVLSRQTRSGGFGLWDAQGGERWLDAYVTDFLSRARAQGHRVPQQAFEQALDNLRNRVNYAPDFDNGGEEIAYALLVLAREGAASLGDLRYYADVKADALATPMAVAQLGAALATYGDQARADALFAQAERMLDNGGTETPLWRADFGTYHRDAAGVLALAAEAGSAVIDLDGLSRDMEKKVNQSPQEAAWQLMAAQALLEHPETSGLRVDGEVVSGPFVQKRAGLSAQEQLISAAGDQPVDLTLTTIGVPKVPPKAGGYGYRIERSYYTLDGESLALDDIAVGTRFVTVLMVVPATGHGARLMVSDPLPAGIEIDNPNLLRSGDLKDFKWLKLSSAAHTEFRKDRFLAAIDSRDASAVTLAYVARAVSPGAFHQPAASVTDMYRPQFRANTQAGRVIIR